MHREQVARNYMQVDEGGESTFSFSTKDANANNLWINEANCPYVHVE
jgi:hypothetical protein